MTNPYASPPSVDDAPLQTAAEATIANAKKRLGRPGTAIIVMASIHAVFDVIFIINDLSTTSRSRLPQPGVIEFSLLLVVHIFQATGAAKMAFLESRRLAVAGMVLASAPCFSPFVLLGIPFGLWGLHLLGQPEIRRAFELAEAGGEVKDGSDEVARQK